MRGDGPVDQLQVKVVGLQLLHALQAVVTDLGVVGIPQFGGQPEIFAADLPFCVQLLKCIPKTGLVLVSLGAVNVPAKQLASDHCFAGDGLPHKRSSMHAFQATRVSHL